MQNIEGFTIENAKVMHIFQHSDLLISSYKLFLQATEYM